MTNLQYAAQLLAFAFAVIGTMWGALVNVNAWNNMTGVRRIVGWILGVSMILASGTIFMEYVK